MTITDMNKTEMMDPVKEKNRMAALKAWETIRRQKIEKIKAEYESIDDYFFDPDMRKVAFGTYRINPPLIKPSKLTWVEKGGVGKELSDGWSLNFAVGCTHACRFCYVDSINKRYGVKRAGNLVNRAWGNYFYTPENINEAIEKTNWKKWEGIEVMMSSTHDAYLPQLAPITRRIITAALENGVKLCVQTRSPLVKKDFDIYSKYKDQVRIQVSVATMNRDLSRLMEPRVAGPEARIEIIREAKRLGLKAGIIIAPVMPPIKIRPFPSNDVEEIVRLISEFKPDFIYGESLHTRGSNIKELEIALQEPLVLGNFDEAMEKRFHSTLLKYGMKGRWWREHKGAFTK
jgi:DNA repair photolyase